MLITVISQENTCFTYRKKESSEIYKHDRKFILMNKYRFSKFLVIPNLNQCAAPLIALLANEFFQVQFSKMT